MPDTVERFLYDLGGWPDKAVDRRRRERLEALIAESVAAERERIANLFVPFIHGEMFDETPENALDLDSTAFAIGERFRFLIGAYPYTHGDDSEAPNPETCPICHRVIVNDAHGGPHPSPGDHDPGEHVLAAYGREP